jgi:hypothetical protein
MLPELLTVVAGEDDDRVFERPEGFEAIEKRAQPLIGESDAAVIEGAREGLLGLGQAALFL